MNLDTRANSNVVSVMSAGVIAAFRFVDEDGDYTAAGGQPYGVSMHSTSAAGELLALQQLGQIAVEAAAAIDVSSGLVEVAVGASGKAITRTTEEYSAGVALTSASASGRQALVNMNVRRVNPVITAADIDSGAVTEAKIGALAVTRAKIGADAIDGTKVADAAIDSEHIVAGAIDAAHLSAGIVSVAFMTDVAKSVFPIQISIDAADLATGAETTLLDELHIGIPFKIIAMSIIAEKACTQHVSGSSSVITAKIGSSSVGTGVTVAGNKALGNVMSASYSSGNTGEADAAISLVASASGNAFSAGRLSVNLWIQQKDTAA